MIKVGPPQYVIFKFSDRKRVVNKFEEWAKYHHAKNCPESFIAWLFMEDYLKLDKIMEDLKADDEIETLLEENKDD